MVFKRVNGKLRSPYDAKKSIKHSSAGIFKQFMGARNRVGIELLYRPARLFSLAELVSWNRFLAPSKFKHSGSGFFFSSKLFSSLSAMAGSACLMVWFSTLGFTFPSKNRIQIRKTRFKQL